MIGERFGRLVVVAACGSDQNGNRLWDCNCDCGEETVVLGINLNAGATKSCGCLQRELRQVVSERALAERRPYTRIAYRNMLSRARTSRTSSVCNRWLNGEKGMSGWACFYADMGPRPQDHKLGRKDLKKPYSPGNCRWTPHRTLRG